MKPAIGTKLPRRPAPAKSAATLDSFDRRILAALLDSVFVLSCVVFGGILLALRVLLTLRLLLLESDIRFFKLAGLLNELLAKVLCLAP